MLLVITACGEGTTDTAAPITSSTATTTPDMSAPTTSVATTSPPIPTTAATTTVPETTTTVSPYVRPTWLGTRLLPLRPDDHGEVQPTPPELADRRLETLDLLPPPESDEFVWTLGPVPDDVLARSSWVPECPVGVDDLVYITVSHWGFDEEYHTGEIVVNAAVGEDVIEVFRQLHAARFPIEQMRVITKEEIDAHPTGDWNDTTSFVCRPAVGSSNWSWHAFGLAIDINPFHNPYLKGDLVLPELASAYLDRDDTRPGMIGPDDIVVQAFRDVGWSWGGNWNSLKDWMHFSEPGG